MNNIWITAKFTKNQDLSSFECLGQKSAASSWSWKMVETFWHIEKNYFTTIQDKYQSQFPTLSSEVVADTGYKLSLWPQQRSTFELKIIKQSQWVQLNICLFCLVWWTGGCKTISVNIFLFVGYFIFFSPREILKWTSSMIRGY